MLLRIAVVLVTFLSAGALHAQPVFTPGPAAAPSGTPFEAFEGAAPQQGESVATRGRSVAVRTVRRSPPRPNVGPRLAARLRSSAAVTVDFVAVGLADADLAAVGARKTGRVGPVVSGRIPARDAHLLSSVALWIDRPQPLRPLLDVSRVQTGADRTDEGRDFPMAARGDGVIVAAYDTGVDLAHPDLRQLDGPSRVVALWNQNGLGAPPLVGGFGSECSILLIAADLCPSVDSVGHGTAVLATAASNGPQFRGVAPEADLLMVQSSTFGALLPALTYASTVAAAAGQPLVFNISLGGQQGPHDGTSLEAQAIDAYPHLVVLAAGNDGLRPLHASRPLDDTPALAVVRFPELRARQDRRAVIDIWGAPDQLDLRARAGLVDAAGAVLVSTATIGLGDPGRTDALTVDTATVGTVDLDAGANPYPFNGRANIRIELFLPDWQDPPNGPGSVFVAVQGTGTAHLWIDSPSSEPVPAEFEIRERVPGQLLGDSANTISDPATAVSGLAVGAYTTRTEATTETGSRLTAPGRVGAIADFTSRGPTLAPEATGAKPDLAAPGNVVITARSRAMTSPAGRLSDLYRLVGGTSFAAPHVAGAAAVLLSARSDLGPAGLKRILLETAQAPEDGDSRWGAGRLDVAEALAATIGRDEGCGCTQTRPVPGPPSLFVLAAIGGLIARRRHKRPPGQ